MTKHVLLFAGVFFTAFGFSQFTQNTEPAIGSGSTLYVIDSMAPSYEAEVGAEAVWDYSSFGGYPGEERTLTVLEPSSTAYGAKYPGATAALDIQNFILNFSYSTTNEKTSPGFVYSDVDLGEIVIVFDVDEAIQYKYPFNLGDSFVDGYEGTATSDFGTNPASGELIAEVDGKGTLKLADGNEFTDVLRYKLTDSTNIVTGFPNPENATFKRTQYEYYDFQESALPIFVFTHVEIVEFDTEFNLIMSSVEPTKPVGIEENTISSVRVYPNPATNEINISLKNESPNAHVSIFDAMGREVLNQSIENDFVSLDVAHLEQGIYFVKISNGDAVESKTVVIK